MDAWKDERSQRIKYEARSSTAAFKTNIKEFKSNGKINIKDLSINYFEVDHKPVKYAYGFNFFHNKKKLTVSGDTTTVSSTNTTIEDNLIELNTGISQSLNDAGIIIERGTTCNIVAK